MKKFLVLSVALLGLAACSTTQEKTMAENKTEKKAEMAAEKMTDSAEAAQSTAKAMGSKSSCALDKDTRVIEVKKTETGGCELFYTKFGEAKSVASSGFGTQYCEEVKDRIQSNLNKAGFACK